MVDGRSVGLRRRQNFEGMVTIQKIIEHQSIRRAGGSAAGYGIVGAPNKGVRDVGPWGECTRADGVPERNVHRLDAGEFGNSLPGAPAQEVADCSRVCCPRVPIADIHGEEFEEAERGRLPCPSD